MKRFLTEYRGTGGVRFGGWVDAVDWDHAQMICDQRGIGERVVGILFAVIVAEHWSHEDADQFLKSLAVSSDGEPPNAELFYDVEMGEFDESIGDYRFAGQE